MEYTLLAFLVVSIVAGSTLHGSVVPYPPLPYKLSYSDVHSPVLLSHHLGLSNAAVLATAGLPVAPAPVSEVVHEDFKGSLTDSQLQQIQVIQTLSESGVGNEGDVPSGASLLDLTALTPESGTATTPEVELPAPSAPADPASESTAEPSRNSPLATLPVVVASANASKALGGANVNVNVHVNVNGDGTASIYNATSESKIKAPIEESHKHQQLH